MAVSFSPAMEAMQYQISCDCGAAVANQVFPSFEVAYKVFTSPVPFEKPVCTDGYCVEYGPLPLRVRAVNEDELTVNMNGGNAGRVMSLLDIVNDGQPGTVDGRWFLTRIREAQSRLRVVGGYEQDALARLEVVASFAASRNAQVVWG